MARAVWSGSISFGLVNVGVKAYTAVRDHTVHFHQLDKKSGPADPATRRSSEKSGKQVDADDIELGYEIAKGRYVPFDPDEIDELRPASTRSHRRRPTSSTSTRSTRSTTSAPTGSGRPTTTASGLSTAARGDGGRERVGIGSVVMRNKQYLAAIRPLDGALAMSTMRFADEVVDVADLDDVPTRRQAGGEGAEDGGTAHRLAVVGVEAGRYHDTFTEELEKIIKAKDKGKEVAVEDQPRGRRSGGIDLMAALEASVNSRSTAKRTSSTRTTKKRTTRKSSARKGTTKKSSGTKSPRTKATTTKKRRSA